MNNLHFVKKCDDKHFQPVVEAVDEPYTVIIHDPEVLRLREESRKEPAVEIPLELPVIKSENTPRNRNGVYVK